MLALVKRFSVLGLAALAGLFCMAAPAPASAQNGGGGPPLPPPPTQPTPGPGTQPNVPPNGGGGGGSPLQNPDSPFAEQVREEAQGVQDYGISSFISHVFEAAERRRSAFEGIAQSLFAMLATLELIISAITWWQRGRGIEAMINSLFMKVLVLTMVFSMVVSYDFWFPTIVEGFMATGAEIAGVTYTEGEIMGEMIMRQWKATGTVMVNMITASLPEFSIYGAAASFALLIVGMVVAFIVKIGFIFVWIYYAMLMLEVAIAVNAGMIVVGFGAFRGTVTMVDKYIAYLFDLGIRIFFLMFMLSVSREIWFEWGQAMKETINAGQQFGVMFQIVAGCLVLTMVMFKIPNKIAKKVTSGFNPGIGNAMSGRNL